MTDTTQAAVDAAETTAKPVVDANNAQNTGDDLESLLSQFEKDTTKAAPATPQTPQQPQPVDPDRLRRVEDRLFQEDLNKTVSNIVGDAKVSPRFAKGWLDQVARERPSIAQAFLQKDNNPEGWKRIEQSLAKEFAKEVKSVTFDKDVTEDRNAVAAAVRGASTPAPAEKAPNYSGMSNAELRAEYLKLGITPTF